jgi:PleD family two-component response regulator
VLPGLPPHAAEASGERFLMAVNGRPVETDCSQPVGVTVSMGMITISHAAFTDPETAVRGADALLYEAKHRGRNQVVYSGNPAECP